MARSGIFRAFHIYIRALAEVRPHWPALAVILGLGLVSVPLSLLLPLPLKLIVDNVLGGKPLQGLAAEVIPASLAAAPASLLTLALAFSVVLGILGIAHRIGEWLFREIVADRMVHRFRGALLRHGLGLPALSYAAQGGQDICYRINQDAQALQWTAIYGLIPVLVSATQIASTLYVTAAISATLAAVALVTAVPTLALVHLYQRRLKAKWHAAKEMDSAAQALVQEVIGAARIVSLFGQEGRETERFLAASWRGLQARWRALRTEALLGALLSLSSVLGASLVLYWGARAVQSEALSVGDLLMIVTYVGQLYAPLQAIGTHVSGQQHALASMERAFAVLDQQSALADRPNALPRGRARGEIEFRGVGFGYDGQRPILRQASFALPAGSLVGIVGRTGAGKTTLVNLLLRLFDPTEGAVYLDGVDLRDWRLRDLRRQFAVVPQDALLLSTSVGENIAYGRPDAPESEILAAAEAASAHGFIGALPERYGARVGERGVRLSGGERQRIALARALLAEAPILVLDEPTSAIDRATEAAIIEGLERVRRGRTVFIIAHRPALLQRVDVLLQVADGTVAVLEGLADSTARKAS